MHWEGFRKVNVLSRGVTKIKRKVLSLFFFNLREIHLVTSDQRLEAGVLLGDRQAGIK